MKLNTNNASLLISAGLPKQFPAKVIPQVAIAGRSNVGKSSLINTLLNRKSLARVSGTPGKTITVNFYNVDNKLMLVDMPGYGFAKRSKSVQKQLEQMISSYILLREQLVNVFVLIDIRHEPQKIDLEFLMSLGAAGIPFSIIFTKADKLSKTALEKQIEENKQELLQYWEELPPVFVTSSEKHIGREEVLEYIQTILNTL